MRPPHQPIVLEAQINFDWLDVSKILTMKLCRECNSEIPKSVVINGKRRNLQNRTRCLICLPFGTSPYNGNLQSKRERFLARKAKNQRDHYHRSKLTHKSNRVTLLRESRKKAIVGLVKGKCQICSYDKCQRNLAFHHVDESQKSHSVSSREFQFSFQRLKPELEKCILVCHNCHGEIHEGLISQDTVNLCHQIWLLKLLPLNDWP